MHRTFDRSFWVVTCSLSLLVAGVVLCGHVSTVRADETPCGGPTGPDIIVSNLDSIANYNPANGIDAFSFGQTHCNLGDAELFYISNTSQHPVFGSSMYRLKDGRFEQVGLSWLFHGFFALSGNACGCGCSPTNGTRLGIGCSNSDNGTIQGQSQGLGPRFEVNALTGAFPFPATPGDPNQAGTSIYKRLQVKIADLNPQQNSGAHYFAEETVVAPDDAAAGNSYNNASYRPINISFTAGNATAAFGSAAMREQPALFAWQQADPSVLITQVDLPNEGRFFLGAKASYVGEGFWQYEYALYNFNSDRAAGAFSVPHPQNVTIDEPGFHDVDYHSGEPFDLTDWTASVGDLSVRWSTESFNENDNANALRWGTLYNFRFRANRQPASGHVTVGLFKPGPIDSIAVSTIVPDSVTPDCNANSLDDACDLACGPAGGPCNVPGCGQGIDDNFDGLLDGCQAFGDVDTDGDVDLGDFTGWSACFQGPEVNFPVGGCGLYDVNGDHDVDMADFRGMMNSFTGDAP